MERGYQPGWPTLQVQDSTTASGELPVRVFLWLKNEIKTLGGVPPIIHETTKPPDPPDTLNAVRLRRSDLLILRNTSVPCTIQNATTGGATMPVDLRLVASPVATPINEGGP
ncbi:MAG: hypothetical protein K6T17_08140 [Fimbriimonadales bacterium]|nr:hypothetical protein [Fimbriimonadales bacterium]